MLGKFYSKRSGCTGLHPFTIANSLDAARRPAFGAIGFRSFPGVRW